MIARVVRLYREWVAIERSTPNFLAMKYEVEHGEDQGRDGCGAQEGHSAGGQGVRKGLAEQQLLDEWGENQ